MSGQRTLERECEANDLSVDVINVVSVTQKAKVEQWIEENEEEVQQALYWRQALDIRNMELSVRKICPANYRIPMLMIACLVGCTPMQMQTPREPGQAIDRLYQ